MLLFAVLSDDPPRIIRPGILKILDPGNRRGLAESEDLALSLMPGLCTLETSVGPELMIRELDGEPAEKELGEETERVEGVMADDENPGAPLGVPPRRESRVWGWAHAEGTVPRRAVTAQQTAKFFFITMPCNSRNVPDSLLPFGWQPL